MELRAEKELVFLNLSDLHSVVIPASEFHALCLDHGNVLRVDLVPVPVTLHKTIASINLLRKRALNQYRLAVTKAHGSAHIFNTFLLWKNINNRMLGFCKL